VLLAVGLFSGASYGVVFLPRPKTDMKRLLAWSSIENLGIVFNRQSGLPSYFTAWECTRLGALALIARALSQPQSCVHQEPFLFLGTGRGSAFDRMNANLGRLGGTDPSHARGSPGSPSSVRWPWAGPAAPQTASFSEWLLLQAFLFAHEVPRSFIKHDAAPRGCARRACLPRLAALRHGEVSSA